MFPFTHCFPRGSPIHFGGVGPQDARASLTWVHTLANLMKRRHGDNKTENKLIIFADGSYIELIAFIDDDPGLREGHWSVLLSLPETWS